MALRDFIKPRLQDWMMGFMDEMRPETVGRAEGEVLEVGFGTGRNLSLYPAAVKSVTGLDPLVTEGVAAVDARVAAARFPVIRTALPADGALPFDAGRFDCVVTTWTLCSIPDAAAALREMRRAEDLAPELRRVRALPAARARGDPRAQRGAHRVCARRRERVARRRVAHERRGDRLGEARPQARAVRLAAARAREIRRREDRVLRAQRRGAVAVLDVEHVGREQRVRGGERARAIGGAVVVDDRVEVVHAFAGAAPQARAVERNRGDRRAVSRADRARERGRVGGDRRGELAGEARGEKRAPAARAPLRGARGHARTKVMRRSAHSSMRSSGSGANSSPSIVNPQLIRSSALSARSLA